MKKTVCVGVVGAGIISDVYLKNMTGKFDNLRVKAVSARHPERARQMGERGFRAVQEKYSWGNEEKKLLALYEELAE